MTLQAFIQTIGDPAAADLFKVKERTAKAWRHNERKPRPEKALYIVQVTADHPAGPVTYEGIYQ